MSTFPDVLWLNVSPSFKYFDRPLLQTLSSHTAIAQWDYCQTPDAPNSFETALIGLHNDVKGFAHPIHLIGHSTSGLLGLLYAQRYPQHVKSLTLLSVGIEPAIDWQFRYYAERRILTCDRQRILLHMVCSLLGCQSRSTVKTMMNRLEQDLDQALSLHSLVKSVNLPSIHVNAPLLVCGSVDDTILDPNHLRSWSSSFRHYTSRLWICPGGRHFFHYFYPQQAAVEILNFWRSCSSIIHTNSQINDKLLTSIDSQ